MADLLARDVLDNDWVRIARELQSMSKREPKAKEPAQMWPGGTFDLEPVEIRRKNAVTDPDSWLNRGLENLAGNTADILMGRESGVPVVDYGASNIPGVGAGAILAAGGMPGVLDVMGAGEMKNLAKIPKYTLQFVSRHFGERGLRNLDNAMTKYPKAGKPSVNDALVIMREGLGGEQVPVVEPYRSTDVVKDLAEISGTKNPIEGADAILHSIMEYGSERVQRAAVNAYRMMQRGIENNDIAMANTGFGTLGVLNRSDVADKVIDRIENILKTGKISFGDLIRTNTETPTFSGEFRDIVRRFKEISESPVQDWERIVESQSRKDARDAAKAAKRAENKPQPVEPVEPVETPAVQEVPVENMAPGWQDWTPPKGSDAFYDRFGHNLNNESKRDLYVVDSLANHWANKLKPEKGFTAARILDALERADARHELTNYNYVSRDFVDDIKKNIETGNMPGTSVKFEQKFKKNRPAKGVTPTLLLSLDERPRYIKDLRIYADEANGPDLYEALFRPRIDRKLHEANPYYWEY